MNDEFAQMADHVGGEDSLHVGQLIGLASSLTGSVVLGNNLEEVFTIPCDLESAQA